ncbi:MAG: site-specific integrase [Sulfuricurvum sp.]|nr:site-specific integrase [Sulfuricurvum sp.]
MSENKQKKQVKFEKSKKYTGVVYQVLQNDDRSYYITYKLANKFHRIHIGKQSEGVNEAFCHQKRNELINKMKFGDDTPVVKHKRAKTFTINELAEVYFEDKANENKSNEKQRGRYDLHIKDSIGEEEIAHLTRDDILKFRAQLQAKKKAPKTVNGIIQLLNAIINYSIKHKNLKAFNPCTGIARLKVDDERERFLSLKEIETLKAKVQEDDILHTFVALSLVTGGRLETILAIKKKDIDLEHDRITLIDLKNGSTYKGFLDSETKSMLQTKLPLLKVNDFIIGGKHTKFPTRTLQRKLLKVFNELFNEGLDSRDSKHRVVIHTLRHTFASQLAITGTPIYTIQKLMNHADIQQTMRYAKLDPNSGKNFVQNLYSK